MYRSPNLKCPKNVLQVAEEKPNSVVEAAPRRLPADTSSTPASKTRDSRVDSGSVDLETPIELSPKSPLDVLDETLTSVMRTASTASPIPPPRTRNQQIVSNGGSRYVQFYVWLTDLGISDWDFWLWIFHSVQLSWDSDFTWNQSWLISIGAVLTILKALNFDIWRNFSLENVKRYRKC